MILEGVNYLYTSFLSVYHMKISYLGVFICVLSAYYVYEEKKTVLFTSLIIILNFIALNNFNVRTFLLSSIILMYVHFY